MGRIHVLSDAVANKIAAGEVVERPASVVKELLENSLDAGGTEFRVDIESGGRRLIRVVDNGCGMIRDDALMAFERHATSKLADVKDLLSIATLGFRGEALPSIGSVSRLVLETHAAEETSGTRIEIAGGKILKVDEAAASRGTSITVRDLFYNVPARKKFLRSDQTELAHIASLVTHYSLAHPAKSFTLRHDSGELLDVAPVETLRERVYQVFGSQILEDLVELGDQHREITIAGDPQEPVQRSVRLRGFISGPQVQKLNRNSIFLFVNRRLIRDRLLMHAISSAYHNLMPPACFPFALLFLDCDPEEVDVNVHPSKTEVRFRHSSLIHDFVRDSIRGMLMAQRPASSIPAPSPAQPGAELPYSEFTEQMERMSFDAPVSGLATAAAPAPADNFGLPEFNLRSASSPVPRFDFSGDPVPLAAVDSGTLRLPVPETHGAFPAGVYSTESATLDGLRDLRPLGQLHDSFIIAAGRDGLWIIDQHVAHERILFEQVLAARSAGRVPTQHLLMPIIVELTAGQQIEYARIAGELAGIGFETEPFGKRTLAVKGAPAAVGAGDVEKLLFEILEIAERELRRVSLDGLRRGMAASIACRAAIKINMPLEQTKMEWLLQALAATSCPMSCPHGRPIALRYSMRDILRSFHRI
jgi:DNA mismatch repair protein MutL